MYYIYQVKSIITSVLAKWNKVLPFSIPFFSAWFLCSLSWYYSYLTVAADIFWISNKFPIFLTLGLYIVWFLCFLFFVVFFGYSLTFSSPHLLIWIFFVLSWGFISDITLLWEVFTDFIIHSKQFRVGPPPRKKARTYLSIFLCMCYSCYSVDINKLL